jgi:hypothetical protein
VNVLVNNRQEAIAPWPKMGAILAQLWQRMIISFLWQKHHTSSTGKSVLAVEQTDAALG